MIRVCSLTLRFLWWLRFLTQALLLSGPGDCMAWGGPPSGGMLGVVWQGSTAGSPGLKENTLPRSSHLKYFTSTRATFSNKKMKFKALIDLIGRTLFRHFSWIRYKVIPLIIRITDMLAFMLLQSCFFLYFFWVYTTDTFKSSTWLTEWKSVFSFGLSGMQQRENYFVVRLLTS